MESKNFSVGDSWLEAFPGTKLGLNSAHHRSQYHTEHGHPLCVREALRDHRIPGLSRTQGAPADAPTGAREVLRITTLLAALLLCPE